VLELTEASLLDDTGAGPVSPKNENDGVVFRTLRSAPKGMASIQVTAKLFNDLPQVVRILFKESTRLLHARSISLWHFFARGLFVNLVHDPEGSTETKGTIDLNQGATRLASPKFEPPQ
jgi:hypothetical protein